MPLVPGELLVLLAPGVPMADGFGAPAGALLIPGDVVLGLIAGFDGVFEFGLIWA
jgi:hypothetical protein